uniref:Nuclear receptor domain-containing protein n=1 Tax=Meloidogyne enterolobii TaxID=390850 RepID=A0A6V7WXQ7_MELEN|nr:unnamed protein product [Meloidogyne enterolobii]
MERKLVNKCQVCDSSLKVSHQYNVNCCSVCAAFFKIYLKNKKQKFECKCLTTFGKIKLRLLDCERCYLNKCLSVGMKEPGCPKKYPTRQQKINKSCEEQKVTTFDLFCNTQKCGKNREKLAKMWHKGLGNI